MDDAWVGGVPGLVEGHGRVVAVVVAAGACFVDLCDGVAEDSGGDAIDDGDGAGRGCWGGVILDDGEGWTSGRNWVEDAYDIVERLGNSRICRCHGDKGSGCWEILRSGLQNVAMAE